MPILVVVVVLMLAGSSLATVTTTNVNSCNGALLPVVKFVGTNNSICAEPPCAVNPGTDLVLNVFFKSPKYLEKIKPNIEATALTVHINYPLFQDDACDGITNTYCPLVRDEEIQYTHTMHLLDVFPEVTVGLKFTIVDLEDNSDVVCFSMDITVVKV